MKTRHQDSIRAWIADKNWTSPTLQRKYAAMVDRAPRAKHRAIRRTVRMLGTLVTPNGVRLHAAGHRISAFNANGGPLTLGAALRSLDRQTYYKLVFFGMGLK